MRNTRKKIGKLLSLIFMLGLLLTISVGCANNDNISDNSENQNETDGKYAKIKFSEMYETKGNEKNVSAIYKSFDGKEVSITGYMAVQSPLDESFIYLVNQPYVSCPFCTIGDITKLEIIPIYMADGSTIKYSETGVTIKGKLEIAEKTDSLEYVTQCRIYADSVSNISDENVDQALQTYYANLSQGGMIIDIQTLQMNIEYATNPEYMALYGASKLDAVKGIATEYSDILDYVTYIKECPEIVKAYEPKEERLITLNNELIDLYNEQIKVLEKFAGIVVRAQMEETTDAEKETLYDEFTKLNSDNLKLYEKFNSWNNKLRE